MDFLPELLTNMGHSTPQGFVGIGLIAVYFCIIAYYSFYRIKKGDHLH